jgi:hypothetical protein
MYVPVSSDIANQPEVVWAERAQDGDQVLTSGEGDDAYKAG